VRRRGKCISDANRGVRQVAGPLSVCPEGASDLRALQRGSTIERAAPGRKDATGASGRTCMIWGSWRQRTGNENGGIRCVDAGSLHVLRKALLTPPKTVPPEGFSILRISSSEDLPIRRTIAPEGAPILRSGSPEGVPSRRTCRPEGLPILRISSSGDLPIRRTIAPESAPILRSGSPEGVPSRWTCRPESLPILWSFPPEGVPGREPVRPKAFQSPRSSGSENRLLRNETFRIYLPPCNRKIVLNHKFLWTKC
jgi:hypothetical protein